MKTCPHCGNSIADEAGFCPFCGMQFGQQAGAAYYPPQGGYAPGAVRMPYDHTAEYEAQDIADNKLFCMLFYLLGILGVLVGLLACKSSPYAMFHIRQAVKIAVLTAIVSLCTLVLAWTLIVPLAAAVCYVILVVVRAICFVQVCSGKAVEPVIVRNFTFLK